MFFISKGFVGYIIPRYVTKIYRVVKQGKYFGHLELGDQPQLFEGGKSSTAINTFISRRLTVIGKNVASTKYKLVRRFTA